MDAKPAHQHKPDCAHNKPVVPKPKSLIDTDTYTIRPDALAFTEMARQMEADLQGLSTGKVNPVALRKKLEREYMQLLQRRTFPRAANIKGAKMLKVIYKRDGEMVTLYMDYLPGETGVMVMGICPECFVNAPIHVDPYAATKPTFIEQRLAWIRGNPEADAKVVTFQLAAPNFTISLDGPNMNRLTVREPIVCPSGRHGPEQRLASSRKCDAVYRIENGFMERRSRKLIRGGDGTKRPITGPIIIVK